MNGLCLSCSVGSPGTPPSPAQCEHQLETHGHRAPELKPKTAVSSLPLSLTEAVNPGRTLERSGEHKYKNRSKAVSHTRANESEILQMILTCGPGWEGAVHSSDSSSVVLGPAVPTVSGNLLEMQIPNPQPRGTASDSGIGTSSLCPHMPSR